MMNEEKTLTDPKVMVNNVVKKQKQHFIIPVNSQLIMVIRKEAALFYFNKNG